MSEKIEKIEKIERIELSRQDAAIAELGDRAHIRAAVRSLYDMQKLRIQNGNRIAAAFRYKLGLHSSEKEESNDVANNLLNELRKELDRITDGIAQLTKRIKFESPLITTYGELKLIETYDRQIEAEDQCAKAIVDMLSEFPISQWLAGVRGCGPLMSGVIVSEINIEKCNSISALWKYCGLDVVQVADAKTGGFKGEGRSRRQHHLEPKEYTNAQGEVVQTKGISFNPFLKTKMVGVLGSSFIKAGGPYRELYDNYKFRLQNHPVHSQKTKAHIHNMAVRYMVKQFLADLWTEWRTLEGLPVRSNYAEGKLGIKHSKAA